jgi:hypothetical protein
MIQAGTLQIDQLLSGKRVEVGKASKLVRSRNGCNVLGRCLIALRVNMQFGIVLRIELVAE